MNEQWKISLWKRNTEGKNSPLYRCTRITKRSINKRYRGTEDMIKLYSAHREKGRETQVCGGGIETLGMFRERKVNMEN